MKGQKIRKFSFPVVPILIVFLFLSMAWEVQAASYTMKAPEAFYSVKLPEEDSYAYNPLYNFSLKLEGWACSERFTETAVYRIREVNRLIQPLLAAQESLVQLEKMLAQMNRDKTTALNKQQVQEMVYRSIAGSIKNSGFASERVLIEQTESLSKEIVENAKKGLSATFSQWGDRNIFESDFYGTPYGIWKLSKMDQDDRSAVFIAQNCYQKNDLEAMMNAIVTAAQKLQQVSTKFNDTKKRVLESTGGK